MWPIEHAWLRGCDNINRLNKEITDEHILINDAILRITLRCAELLSQHCPPHPADTQQTPSRHTADTQQT